MKATNKKLLAIVMGTVLCGLVNSAFAADTADLTVKGTLLVGSCTPTLDGGGVVDYGQMPISDLSAVTANDLKAKTVNLTVSCDSAMKVGFNVTDDNASTAAGKLGPIEAANAFGLGATADKVNIGSYSLDIASVSYDGNVGDVITSTDNGTTWAKSAGDVPNTAGAVYSAAAAGTDDTPVAITTATYGVNVDAVVQDTKTLNITDDTDLDGQATFTLVYL
jgi:hypothetical protein